MHISTIQFSICDKTNCANRTCEFRFSICVTKQIVRKRFPIFRFSFHGTKPIRALTGNQSLEVALDTCRILEVPVAAKKIEGLSTCIVYLGIQIDTTKGEIRLPEDKLTRLLEELDNWPNKKACNKWDLLSLIGRLHHGSSF